MRRLCLLLLLLTITVFAGSSAHADASVWPVTPQCFADATPPPKDWTFSGTLLMVSTGRLHAFQQGWITPRILLFSQGISGSTALSPDKRWYAVDEYQRHDEAICTTFHDKAIHVYSLVDDQQYVVPWDNTFGICERQVGHQFYWLDNQHLIYSLGDALNETWFEIDPFTGKVEPWNAPFNPSQSYFALAPNSKEALYSAYEDDYVVLDKGRDELQLPIWNVASWKPDSSGFAAYTADAQYRPSQFAVYNADGKVTDTLMNIQTDVYTGLFDSENWSPDEHYLLFSTDHLYIADMEKRTVIDTCIPVDGFMSAVWSPSNTQFALISQSDQDNRIQIFDLQAWKRYVVGYSKSLLIGWRAEG